MMQITLEIQLKVGYLYNKGRNMKQTRLNVNEEGSITTLFDAMKTKQTVELLHKM